MGKQDNMHNWDNIHTLLDAINKTNYLILRNFDDFPDHISENEDIDILCENKNTFINDAHAYPLSDTQNTYNFFVSVNNKKIYMDIRVIGDGYYDKNWEQDMLKHRVFFRDSFYIMDTVTYKYSLLYHSLLHKRKLENKYRDLLPKLFFNELYDTSQPVEKQLRSLLCAYMSEKGYHCTIPNDPGVFINKFLYKYISAKVHLQRLKRRPHNHTKHKLRGFMMQSFKKSATGYLPVYGKCLQWIMQNSIQKSGISITSKQHIIYPEVTGYYIPSLLAWGERELAISYANYLCSIQKEDGSWYGSDNQDSYVFDSAQILKGLISIREILPEVDSCILKGCDWLLTNMQDDGRLTTPSRDAWGKDENFCSELIHLYCLSPLADAGSIFAKPKYTEAAHKILAYYKREKMDRITDFSLLSHFYAYVMEGLCDLGETDLARKCMENLSRYQNRKGGIPGLKNVPWVCSTGMFQLALVWYKLGELEKGNRLFYYACSFQNPSGGWYGSYPVSSLRNRFYWGKKRPYYFPDEEISWANKYFLDALAYKERLTFEKMSSIFSETIDDRDGRLSLVSDRIAAHGKNLKICDAGCGKGRYLKILSQRHPNNKYYAMDISAEVMKRIDYVTGKKTGSLTQIPWPDNFFDFVYTCEALEHAIHLNGALLELYRVIKPGGQLVIIDKPLDMLGALELYEWEQWIADDDIRKFAKKAGGNLEIIKSVAYEGKDDGLFRAWIITKNS